MIGLDISDLYCIFSVSFSHNAEEVCGAAGFVCAVYKGIAVRL